MSGESSSCACQTGSRRLSVAIVLPGLHCVNRGAEVALESIAVELQQIEDFEITLFGMGISREDRKYQFIHVPGVRRDWFRLLPSLPLMRDETIWEELSFAVSLRRRMLPSDFDLVISCSYPFVNWAISRGTDYCAHRPKHIFVTQNGDWPARCKSREYKYFRCDALVCTNPEYFDANQGNWPCRLIPNGVDTNMFCPGKEERASFGLAKHVRTILMVSALIPSKRVLDGIRAVAELQNAQLVIAGDGPLADPVRSLGGQLMGDRFHLLQVARDRMPALYRSADALLHMSIDEPSANAYMEAMAVGIPVVTHDRRVTRWTFDDLALLVDTTVQLEVVTALQIALKSDARTKAIASRRRATELFTWRAIAGQYASLARDLVRGQPHRHIAQKCKHAAFE